MYVAVGRSLPNCGQRCEPESHLAYRSILIASVPVYAYILMLSFVVGYCDFFHVPLKTDNGSS